MTKFEPPTEKIESDTLSRWEREISDVITHISNPMVDRDDAIRDAVYALTELHLELIRAWRGY